MELTEPINAAELPRQTVAVRETAFGDVCVYVKNQTGWVSTDRVGVSDSVMSAWLVNGKAEILRYGNETRTLLSRSWSVSWVTPEGWEQSQRHDTPEMVNKQVERIFGRATKIKVVEIETIKRYRPVSWQIGQ
jgi:hypothetical protein